MNMKYSVIAYDRDAKSKLFVSKKQSDCDYDIACYFFNSFQNHNEIASQYDLRPYYEFIEIRDENDKVVASTED